MTDLRAADPPARPGGSVLIYGEGESPMAVLASALAHREVGGFRWADGAAASRLPETEALRVLEEGSGQGSGPRVPAEELLPPGAVQSDFRDWLELDASDSEAVLRLSAFLRLPSVLQLLIARAPEPAGRVAIVLTNVDALPIPALENALGQPEAHDTMRREGVLLFVTFRGSPSVALRTPFDRIYRIEGHRGQMWQEATVTVERGEGADGLSPGRSLGERLPWLGLSGSAVETPVAIPRHRLR
ncbi:MAG: hypothetical protein L3J92_04375 [Thermoplasmata archaeon]|jgi:hypothetical protein|nr:hypothetical protein [Thermoplasmata archaeon]